MNALRTAVATAMCGAIRAYQLVLSPLIGPRCRHLPGCSEYAMEAIREHGPIAGCWLAVCRIARCQPFGTSGYDPVPPAAPRGAPRDPVPERD